MAARGWCCGSAALCYPWFKMKLKIQAVKSDSFSFSVACILIVCAFVVCGLPARGGEWVSITGGRSIQVQLSTSPRNSAGFTLLPPSQTGVLFTNVLSDEAASENQIRLNGSGVALGDVDGDGWLDIYFCGLENGNRLFRNLGGMRFEDATAQAGVACAGQYSTGCVLADIDGDGDLDLLVNGIGTGTRLFMNDEHGKFAEQNESGLWRRSGATSMALADVDGDGDLDLYVANYRTTTIRSTGFALLNVNGKRLVRPEDREDLEIGPNGKVLEHGEPDAFYINQGGGKFARVSWTGGGFLDENGLPLKSVPRDWGLSAMFRDINQDGLPDLYVCNDFQSPDRVWINTGAGSFRAVEKLALRHTSTFSMSVDFADIDRDGQDDFFLADMLDPRRERRMAQFSAMEPNPSTVGVFDDRPQYNRNTLHRNRGDGTYAEVAYYAGMEASAWTWCAAFLDVDLDGYEDLLMTTGHLFDTQDLDAADRIYAAGPWRTKEIPKKLLRYPRLKMPKMAFRNTGSLRFVEMGHAWGFDQEGVAHGLALADLDNDGDLDVVVNNLNDAAGIYRNDTPRDRVAVRLRGAGANTRGIGARIRLISEELTQSQEMIAGGRYLSSDESMRSFAWVGKGPVTLEVRWLSGMVTILRDVQPNRIYEVAETAAIPDSPTAKPGLAPLFSDVTESLPHRHEEAVFDDFKRQPLLPNRLSQLGPSVAWVDADGDGWEDLWIGGGRGGRCALFRNEKGRTFELLAPVETAPLPRCDEVSSVAPAPGVVISSHSNYATESTNGVDVVQQTVATGARSILVQGFGAGVGPLALADLRGDGVLELFAGGRCVPGRYPEPASSILLRQAQGRWVPDETNRSVLESAGLVSGAVFSDLNSDGYPDLVLACEWGSVRVLLNEQGRLVDATKRFGLDRFTGWWTSVVVVDLDEDGRLDLVAGNWGLNSKYRASPEHPRRLYHGDFDTNGTMDLIETYDDTRLGREVPERDLSALRRGIPSLMAHYETFSSYAAASIQDVLGSQFALARKVEANTLSSMVFFNRTDHFDAVALPAEAQLAPAMGVVAADFDGDGHQDIFLAQNFFAVEPTTSRNDAGRGLLLKGDGHGGLGPVSGAASGIRIYGEQRGAACADFDHDGRMDLVVTQNGAATKLYRNSSGKRGLRVNLRGPAGNPLGLGVAVRLKGDRGQAVSPWQEVSGGSGSGSQNASALIFPMPGSDAVLESRWPGGKVISRPVAAGVFEAELKFDGIER